MGRVPKKAAVAAVLGVTSASIGTVAGITPSLCALLILTGAFLIAVVISWRMTHDIFAPLPLVLGYLFWGTAVRGLALEEGLVPDQWGISLANHWISVSVWLLAALAIICCCFGYRSHTGRRIGVRWKLRGVATDGTWRTSLKVYGILAAALDAVAFINFYREHGELPGFQIAPAVLAAHTYQGGTYLGNIAANFALTGLLLLWGRRRLGWLGRFALIANALLVVMNIVEGSKTIIFTAIICIFVLRHYLRRRMLVRTAVILAVPALVLASLAFYYKEYGFHQSEISQQYSQAPLWQAVLEPPVNRSYQFDATSAVLAKTRSVNDYSFGGTMEELLWWYVPRQWWPAKPRGYGYSFGVKYFGSVNPTISYAPGMLAELYLNFGVAGVVGGFYLLGICLRICYEAFSRRRSQFATVIYAVLLCRFIHMIEGPIATHIEFVIAQLVPLVVYAIITRSVAWRSRYPALESARFRAARLQSAVK